MPNTSDPPDLELILRGRPVDPAPIRVHIVASHPPRRESDLPRFVMQALMRRWRLIATLATLGFLAGSAFNWALTPIYSARTSVEVIPPANAESLIKRIAARRLMESPAVKLNIQSLPEYTRSNAAVSFLRRVAGLAATPAVPPQDEFLRALDSRTRIAESAQGHVIDFEFEASDPSRAAAFLDLLTEEIVRDQADSRAESSRQTQETLAPLARIARTEMQAAEEDLVVYTRSAALAISTLAKAHINTEPLRAEQAIRLALKQRDSEAQRMAYQALIKRSSDAELENVSQAGVRRLAPAQVSNVARTPRMFTHGLLGALAGLLLAVPVCLILESLKHSVGNPRDVTRLLGIPLLGVIPHASLRKTVPSYRYPNAGIIDLNPGPETPGGPAFFASSGDRNNAGEVRTADLGESFREVLASIWIAGQNGKRPRVLLFASPASKEGKTTIVANLGIALAHTRRRVLLIEADLRNPQIHAIFGAPARWGLANLLEEDDPVESYSFEDLVFKTDVPGLYVLPAGNGDLSIAGMRHIDRLTELLLRFRLEFHAVLIDTPAASDYPDARIVARLSDAAVIVLRANESSPEQAQALVRQFMADGTAVLGAVLNDCKTAS